MDPRESSDEGNEGKSDMKDAVSFLLRGGSLLSSPCARCNGVQIEYKGETICINCGEQQPTNESTPKPMLESQVSSMADHSHDLSSIQSLTFEEAIEERIAEQFKILKSTSNDLEIERQRIELIRMYFDLIKCIC